MLLRRPFRPLLLTLLLPVLALAGCGGGGDGDGGGERSIGDVRTCLEDAGLTLGEPPGEEDPNVADGVLATTGVPSTDPAAGETPPAAQAEEFLMALAAEVKDEATVKQFEEDSDSLAQTLSQGGAEKLEVDSGSDGRYVWAVAGAPGAEAYDEARGCVER